ncbi:Uncharacterised protein [Chlamydia trachomatis]|nr:Uncharacterised protein [Chlamydia trachomatis]
MCAEWHGYSLMGNVIGYHFIRFQHKLFNEFMSSCLFVFDKGYRLL